MERFAFVAEWLDPRSGIIWRYQLFYYAETQEIEMYDIKNRRHFLKRVKCEDVALEQLYLGAIVTVYARQLKLIEYGDDFTRAHFETRTERTLAMIKPDAGQHVGKILNAISQSGLLISNVKMCRLTVPEAERFYEVHRGQPFYERLVEFMTSGKVVAIELVGKDAIARWRQLLGPTDSHAARQTAPESIRAHFGADKTHNACHGSDARDTAAQEVDFFFGAGAVAPAYQGRATTLAVVKPHVVKDGTAGLLVDLIAEHFELAGLQMHFLDKPSASEFYEVYKGVVQPGEFSAMVDQLTSGPCIAVEVADRDGADPVEGLRQLCGPTDPELARVLRPQSLRAQFGVNAVLNAVHCTDLPEDGPLETQYFFQILQKT